MKTIDEMYAFIIVDPEDGDEGIPTFSPMPGVHAPMIGADPDRVLSLRSLAEQVATDMQAPVKVVRFSVREELEIIQPGPKPEREEPEIIDISPGPPRVAEDGTITGWADAPEMVLTEADVDVAEGGVHVFSLLLDGKVHVAFQFMRADESSITEHPVALADPHAARVGPLAIAAWAAGDRALRQQSN